MKYNPAYQIIPIGAIWVLRRYGSTRATKLFSNKTEAINYGKKLATKMGVSFYEHNKNGTVKRTIR